MDRTIKHVDIVSPIGQLRIFACDAAIVAIDLPTHANPSSRESELDSHHSLLRKAATQLDEWFAGRRTEFALPLAAAGSEFQKSVWSALIAIPFGETRSYGQIAADLGLPRSSRAVGAANRCNPIPIIVPCHRVIGSDGSLTGYAGGLAIKRWLLDHEARASHDSFSLTAR